MRAIDELLREQVGKEIDGRIAGARNQVTQKLRDLGFYPRDKMDSHPEQSTIYLVKQDDKVFKNPQQLQNKSSLIDYILQSCRQEMINDRYENLQRKLVEQAVAQLNKDPQ